MAPAEGAVADTTTTTAAPDSTTASTSTGTQATSQPAPKWEDTPQYKGQVAELQKERKSRQDFEKRIADYESKLTEERRRVAALSGITPPDPKQADAELVRSKILELMPELADLGSINEMRTALEEQQVRGFADHSKRMISQIHGKIASEFGGDLNARQQQFVNAAYLYENQTNPAFHARHNQGDPTLIDEFVKDMIDNMVEPVRRKAATSEANRFRPVPGGRDRSTPIKGEKILKGEDMLRAHFKEKTR